MLTNKKEPKKTEDEGVETTVTVENGTTINTHESKRLRFAVQWNHDYTRNVKRAEMSAEDYDKSVKRWFTEVQASLASLFEKRKGIERISYILHSQDEFKDKATGKFMPKPAHVHAVIEFKHGSGITKTRAIKLFNVSREQNCEVITDNLIMARRYLLHISEGALFDGHKHIYNYDELHFLTKNNGETFRDLLGVHNVDDAKAMVRMFKASYHITDNTIVIDKDTNPKTPYEHQIRKQRKLGFDIDVTKCMQMPEAYDMQYSNMAMKLISRGTKTIEQTKTIIRNKMKEDSDIPDDVITDTFESFWASHEADFKKADNSYRSMRHAYLTGALTKDELDPDATLSPLDDPNNRHLTTGFISGEGGTGKSQLAKYLAQALNGLPRGIHFAPGADAGGKTYDFANTYNGEDVTVLNDLAHNSMQDGEILTNFDPVQLAPVSSRNNDVHWFAHNCIVTSATNIACFAFENIQFSKGGSRFMNDAKELVLNDRFWDHAKQWFRRFAYYIECKKLDETDGKQGSAYYIYVYHEFNKRADDASGDNFGYYYAGQVVCDNVRDGEAMKQTAEEVKSYIEHYATADTTPDEFKAKYVPDYSYNPIKDIRRGNRFGYELIDDYNSKGKNPLKPLGELCREGYTYNCIMQIRGVRISNPKG